MERHGRRRAREASERLRYHARAASRRVVDAAEDVLDRHVPRHRHQRIPVPRLHIVASRFESLITPLPEASNGGQG